MVMAINLSKCKTISSELASGGLSRMLPKIGFFICVHGHCWSVYSFPKNDLKLLRLPIGERGLRGGHAGQAEDDGDSEVEVL